MDERPNCHFWMLRKEAANEIVLVAQTSRVMLAHHGQQQTSVLDSAACKHIATRGDREADPRKRGELSQGD